jgi:hypothetical protein
LVNIVPGLLVAAVVWVTIDIDKPDFSLLHHFDVLGLLLMATFLGCLQYALQEGPRWDWLDDPTIRTAMAVSILGGSLFFVGIDDHQSIGLRHLRCDFREVLGARHADRDRQAKLRPHAAADRLRNFSGRTKEPSAARHISKRFVDRNPLDERCEITHHLDGCVAQALVILEMAADKSELRAKLARLPSCHAAADAERPGFVGSGEHDPATDGDGSSAQGRVEQLFDRGIKGVQVRMEDRCFHLGGPPTEWEHKTNAQVDCQSQFCKVFNRRSN